MAQYVLGLISSLTISGVVMSTIELPKGGPKYERLKLKPCQFPGCDEYYMGTGFSKYCHEHRKRQYRKILDKKAKKAKKTPENPNQTYHADVKFPTESTFKCECCGVPFTVIVYPSITVYPKYCQTHRNEWKRKFYYKTRGILEPTSVVVGPSDDTHEIMQTIYAIDEVSQEEFEEDVYVC